MTSKFGSPLTMAGPKATTSAYHPNQVPTPALPPTPPGSAGSSPPPPPYLPTQGTPRATTSHYQSPSFGAGSTNMSSSTSGMGHDGPGPSRRHQYDMPETPQGGVFPTGIKGARADYIGRPEEPTLDSPYRMYRENGTADPYHPAHLFHRPARPRRPTDESGWEGTLSAAIASTIASVRAAWVSADTSSPVHHFDGTSNGSPGPLGSGSVGMPSSPISGVVRKVAHLSQGISISGIRFGLLCALWYSMSALSSNTGKVILTAFRYPVTLTFVQFGFVAGWCAVFIAFREGVIGGKFAAGGGLGGAGGTLGGAASLLGIKRPTRTALFEMFIMSLFQIAGHVFSSMAIARVPVSTVHTIKALSPLFTVIAYAGLFGVRYSATIYVSLLPLTLGVMLACSFELRANGVGFLCALGSTIVFVSQNIFGKKLLPKDDNKAAAGAAGGPKMDKLSLLFYSSGMAYLLMIPIWLWSDGASLFSSWLTPSYGAGSRQASGGTGALRLMFYFLCNGSVHFAQCILAFSILARTSPVTYSIASLIKRIAVIFLAIVWFGQKTSLIQAFGMCMTFAGLWMYNRAKGDVERGERKRGQVERKADLLLPSNKEDARLLDGFSDSSRAVSPMPLFAGAAYSNGIAAPPARPAPANGFAYPPSLAPSHIPPPSTHLAPASTGSTALSVPESDTSTLTTSPKSLDRQLASPPPPPSGAHAHPLASIAERSVVSPPPTTPSHPQNAQTAAAQAQAPPGRGSPADGATSGAQARTVADASSAVPKRRGPSISLERGQPVIGMVR